MSFPTPRTLILLLALGAAAACASPSSESARPAAAAAEATNGLVVVEDASRVCMINDTYMGQPQERVVVDGKTYFGCCPACKERLDTEPATRIARDPVTGEVVDKARAVIARDDRNAILYFASAQNVRKYRPVP